MSELQKEVIGGDESIFYESAAVEALKNWRKLSKEERDKLKKGDDVDEIDTTDLENFHLEDDKEDDPESGFTEMSFEFLERYHINVARYILGEDGGVSIRRLKKLLKLEREAKAAQKVEESKK
jgi:hypothetical protein